MSLKKGTNNIGVVIKGGSDSGTTDHAELDNLDYENSGHTGFQEEITSSNKLNSDLVDDSNNTNKFMTTTEKTKLAGLNNYNDNEVRTLISNKVDKVTGKALSKNDYTDEEKQKLASINMAGKQDALVSGVSIKTINNTSLLGSGDISTSTPTDAQVTTAVDDWLDAHPEATTTVEDGSISVDKLAQDTERLFFNGNNLMGHQANVLYELPKDWKAGEDITVSTADGSVFSNDSANENECLLRFMLYDANKTYLDYYTLKNGQNYKTMTLPDTFANTPIRYLSWNIDTNFYGDIMVNYGSSKMTYEEYKKEPPTPEEQDYELYNLNQSIIYSKVQDAEDIMPTRNQLSWVIGDINSSTGQDTTSTTRFLSTSYIDLKDVEEIRLIKLHTDWQMAPWFYTSSDGTNNGISSLVNHSDNGTFFAYDKTYTKDDFNGARFMRLTGRRQNNATLSNTTNTKWYYVIVKRKKQNETYDTLYYSSSTLEQGKIATKTTTGIMSDATAVTTRDCVALPYNKNLKLKVYIENGFEIAIGVGNKPSYLQGNNTLGKYYSNGDIIDVPNGVNFYRIEIRKRKRCASSFASFYDLTPAEASKVNLKLFIVSEQLRKLEDKNAIKLIETARLHTVYPPGGQTDEQNTFKNIVIAHTSDTHGDYTRLQHFYDFCKELKPALLVNTGDTVSYDPGCGVKWVHNMVKDYSLPQMLTIGNHDVYPTLSAPASGSVTETNLTDQQVYDYLYSDIATELGNTTGKTYYYRDIAESKIRAICVNLYMYGGTNRKRSHLTDDVLSWFASTLASTPSGYGIIVLQHSHQDTYAPSEGYTTFFTPLSERKETAPAGDAYNDIDGTPLYDIVDAFIGRTTINQTYTQTGSPSTCSVTADFSSVNENIDFIAWLSGHIHTDTIHFVTGRTHRQVELNVTTTASIYGSLIGNAQSYPYYTDSTDQARLMNGETEDAFNVYVIDRDNKKIKIVRVGNNKRYDMQDRTYMEMPYTDDE